jgi:uncharacterized protein with PhoU and TrkA domain
MTVLALRAKGSTDWTYNPDASVPLEPGMTLVVFGSAEQIGKLRASQATGGS